MMLTKEERAAFEAAAPEMESAPRTLFFGCSEDELLVMLAAFVRQGIPGSSCKVRANITSGEKPPRYQIILEFDPNNVLARSD